MINKMMHMMKRICSSIAIRFAPVRWKEFNELKFWKDRKKAEGILSSSHYKYLYTKPFCLNESYYDNKFILDLGCGPRGSLEWATMASRRIGLDPLAKKYLKLGADQHQMEYIDSPAEAIPLENAECDVVCSFNSLDHVQDVDKTLKEIKRITRPGGLFLLLVEVNHASRICEPHELIPQEIVELLKPEFICESLHVYKPVEDGMYRSIRADVKLPNPEKSKKNGYMSARILRSHPSS